jgi:PPOX class probable F420-dependent enzyme
VSTVLEIDRQLKHYEDLLGWETKAFAHVATIGPDGAPQNNPVWFDWDGQHLRFSQTSTRQKLRNLEREPRLALSILDPDNGYRYLEIRGRVVRVEPDPDKAFIDRMAQKYLGQEKYPWNRPGDERVIIVVEPLHTTAMG